MQQLWNKYLTYEFLNAFTMRVLRYMLVVLIGFTFLLCQPQRTNHDLLIEIPDTTESELDIIPYLVKNKLVTQLNLNRLENGVDSFELRFNTRISLIPYGQLLIIKKIDNRWTCIEYNYVIKHPVMASGQKTLDYVQSFAIDTIQVVKKNPSSGWLKFLTSIDSRNIYDLPDQEDIRAWDSLHVAIADGTSYFVEFANDDRYKFYSYTDPQFFAKYFNECRKMTEIIGIFDREFGLNDSIADVLASRAFSAIQ